MIKTIPAVVILLCISLTARAQDVSPEVEATPWKHRISLQLGSAAPVGQFKSNQFEDPYPPFARIGFLLQGSYARDLSPGIALGATAGWRRNTFDLDEFAREDDELVLSRSASAWHTAFALADVYLQTRTQHFIGYLKGSLGGAHSKSPFMLVETHYGHILRTSDRAFSLAYGLAGGVGVQVDQVRLTLEIGNLATKPVFEVTDARHELTRYKQSMQTVQVSVGAGYSF